MREIRNIVILTGANWDSDFKVLGAPFAKNVAYTFHKYWMPPVVDSIREYLDFSERHNVPVFIGETGETFRLYLGAGIVTNGINCAMLGYSVADADLVNEGESGSDWEAVAMEAGLVTIGYSGACLFAGTVNGTDQALLVGAELKFTTGFTADKQ